MLLKKLFFSVSVLSVFLSSSVYAGRSVGLRPDGNKEFNRLIGKTVTKAIPIKKSEDSSSTEEESTSQGK